MPPLSAGLSAFNLRDYMSANPSVGVSTTETVLADNPGYLSAPFKWDAIASDIKAGLAAVATLTGQPVTVRIRVGGVPSNRNIVAGTIIHSFVIPVGSNQVIEEFSPAVTPSPNLSYVQLTGQTSSGTGTLTLAHAAPLVIPIAKMQAQLFCNQTGVLWSGTTENMKCQWPIDCDRFESDSLLVAFAGRAWRSVGGTGTFRLRLGGTSNGADGDVVLSLTTAAESNDGILISGQVTIPNPGGKKFLKVSSQSGLGFAWQLNGHTVLVKGV